MSYFFVDEVPQDELPNPTDDYSVLESKNPRSFNPMSSQVVNRVGDRISTLSQARSFVYKQSVPTVFSDKAMQLKHKGLFITQIIVGQIEFTTVKKLRKNSSKAQLKDKSVKQQSLATSQKFQKVLLLLEKSKGPSNGTASLTEDRSLPVNTHKEVIHIAELDKELGYNFLKKCKLNLRYGIFQIFESKQTNLVLIVTNKGDLFQFDLIRESLLLVSENPNNSDITKYFEKIKSAEMFDGGSRIALSMGNGDLLVYHLNYLESKIEMMIGPYDSDQRSGSRHHSINIKSTSHGPTRPSAPNSTTHFRLWTTGRCTPSTRPKTCPSRSSRPERTR